METRRQVGKKALKVKFDRRKPGGGVEIRCKLENGKAWLAWEFYFQGERAEAAATLERQRVQERALQVADLAAGHSASGIPGSGRKSWMVEVTITDRDGHLAAYGTKCLDEEEPLEMLLLYPHLWNGMKDPYLYEVEARLLEPEGCLADRVCLRLPLRETAYGPDKGVLLNGKVFLPRAVRYVPPYEEKTGGTGTGEPCWTEACGWGESGICQGADAPAKQEAGPKQDLSASVKGTGTARGAGTPTPGMAKALQIEQMRQDFLLLREMGANCIHYEAGRDCLYEVFCQMCDKYGFLVWEQKEGICCRAGQDPARDCLLDVRSHPTALYYRYRAKWGRSPFVYLVPESVCRQADGTFTATVFSNCPKVALYTDGHLHGFLAGEEEFVFQGIPARHPCIMLDAEGEGCNMALSLHKSYVVENVIS